MCNTADNIARIVTLIPDITGYKRKELNREGLLQGAEEKYGTGRIGFLPLRQGAEAKYGIGRIGYMLLRQGARRKIWNREDWIHAFTTGC